MTDIADEIVKCLTQTTHIIPEVTAEQIEAWLFKNYVLIPIAAYDKIWEDLKEEEARYDDDQVQDSVGDDIPPEQGDERTDEGGGTSAQAHQIWPGYGRA